MVGQDIQVKCVSCPVVQLQYHWCATLRRMDGQIGQGKGPCQAERIAKVYDVEPGCVIDRRERWAGWSILDG